MKSLFSGLFEPFDSAQDRLKSRTISKRISIGFDCAQPDRYSFLLLFRQPLFYFLLIIIIKVFFSRCHWAPWSPRRTLSSSPTSNFIRAEKFSWSSSRVRSRIPTKAPSKDWRPARNSEKSSSVFEKNVQKNFRI